MVADAPTQLAPAGAAPAVAAGGVRPVPLLFHLLVLVWLEAMLLLARYAFERYFTLLQEDREVEWGTVLSFLAAGLVGLYYAIRRRRVFDGLVALFCIFVGGEEFSWGQRLLGISPPEFFLGHNAQQELNLHNLVEWKAHTLILSLALFGYGILLPLLARSARARRLLDKVGASAPPLQFAGWFGVVIVLTIWHPVRLHTEWLEFISGGLFLAGSVFLFRSQLTNKSVLAGFAAILLFGVLMTRASDALERRRDTDRVACADAEARNLLYDMLYSKAATARLLNYDGSVHKRIWRAEASGYVDGARLREFGQTRCTGAAAQHSAVRHRYAVDPWGSSYWFFIENREDGRKRLAIYSFGPNRRRDSPPDMPEDADVGDDIIVSAALTGGADNEPHSDSADPFSLSPMFDP